MIIRGLLVTIMLTAAGIAEAAPPSPKAAEGTQVAVTQASGAAADASDAAAERKICRTEKATGSLTRRNRVCLTQAQWQEVHDRTRRGVDEMVGSASGAPSCVSGMDVACGAPNANGPLTPTGM